MDEELTDQALEELRKKSGLVEPLRETSCTWGA